MITSDDRTETAVGPDNSARSAAIEGPGVGVICVAKLDRLIGLLDALHAELRVVELDGASRSRVAQACRDALVELASNVDDAVIAEMVALGLGRLQDDAPDETLRIELAQLLGWARGARTSLRGAEPDCVVCPS
jgi:hypothetical protein